MQSNAIISRSSLSRYYRQHCGDSSKTWITLKFSFQCFFNSVLQLIFSIFRNNSYTSPFNSSTEGTLLKCMLQTAHNACNSKDVDALKFQIKDQRKRQCPASLAFVRGIHRWPFDIVIMQCTYYETHWSLVTHYDIIISGNGLLSVRHHSDLV